MAALRRNQEALGAWKEGPGLGEVRDLQRDSSAPCWGDEDGRFHKVGEPGFLHRDLSVPARD